jgi:hypothetical protein
MSNRDSCKVMTPRGYVMGRVVRVVSTHTDTAIVTQILCRLDDGREGLFHPYSVHNP